MHTARGVRRGSTVAAPVLALIGLVCARSQAAQAQDLGHKLVGTVGLDAGSQPPPGLYLADRLVYYRADRAYDRDGDRLDIAGLDIDAVGNALGVAAVLALPAIGASYGAAAAAPIASVRLRSDRPEASVDRFGLGDVALKPIQLGWRFDGAAVLAEYAVYIPTGRFEAGASGVSQGHVTHQLSVGGTVGLDPDERWFVAALASYDMNQKKRGVDITRGDTLQLQGGVGARPSPVWEIGLAAYALWQVEDDRGDDLPVALRGARDRVYGVGPEVAVRIPALGIAVRLRYEVELGVRSRPGGQILSLGVSYAVIESEAERGSGRR